MIFITALSLPFLAKKPIDLPPIVSVELIQISEKTNIPFAPKAKKIIEEVKKKEKEKITSEQAPPKKVIGWNHGGTKEILEKLYPDGLVKLGDLQDLSYKVEKISDKNHPMPSENIYTSERMINKTLDLYYQLLNRSS